MSFSIFGELTHNGFGYGAFPCAIAYVVVSFCLIFLRLVFTINFYFNSIFSLDHCQTLYKHSEIVRLEKLLEK